MRMVVITFLEYGSSGDVLLLVMAKREQEAAMQQDQWRRLAAEQAGTLLFETSGEDVPGTSYLFQKPLRILTADDEISLLALLEEVDKEVKAGFYVAGLLRYEAGYAFERVRNRRPQREPLAWFGVYGEPERAIFPHRETAPLLATPLCFALGWLSWHFVERPMLKLKRRPAAPLAAG